MKKLKLNLDELRNQLESIDNDDAKTLLGGKTIHLSHNPNDDFWLPKDNEFQNYEVTDTIDYYDSGEDFDVEFDQSFGTTNYGGYGQNFPTLTLPALWTNYDHNVGGVPQSPSDDNYPHQCAIRLGKAIEQAYGYSFNTTEYTQNWGPVTSEGWPRGAETLANFLYTKMGAPIIMSQSSFENSSYASQSGIIFFKDLTGGNGRDHIDIYSAGSTGSGYYSASEIWFFPL